jgi:hypothetical protein
MGRAYSRPTSGTTKCPEKNAFNTPRSGRASSAAFSIKIGRFEVDQQPKLREIDLVKLSGRCV